MLSFDDEIVDFKFKGVDHSVRKPNNGDIKEYTESLKRCEDDESKEKALVCFLEKLGLNEETFKAFTPSQLKKLLAELHDFGKN